MPLKKFYRLVLLLPFAVPLVASAIALRVHLTGWADVVITGLAAAGLYGIVPYGVFALFVAVGIGRWAPQTIRQVEWVAPFICLALYLAFTVAIALVRGRPMQPIFSAGGLLISSLLVLPVGYFYVGLIELLRALGLRLQWIADAEAAS